MGCLASFFLLGPCWLSVWLLVFCSALVGLLGRAIGRHSQIEGVAHSNLSGCPTLSLEAASDEDMVVTGCRNNVLLRLLWAVSGLRGGLPLLRFAEALCMYLVNLTLEPNNE